jgi:hypothetical protein
MGCSPGLSHSKKLNKKKREQFLSPSKNLNTRKALKDSSTLLQPPGKEDLKVCE